MINIFHLLPASNILQILVNTPIFQFFRSAFTFPGQASTLTLLLLYSSSVQNLTVDLYESQTDKRILIFIYTDFFFFLNDYHIVRHTVIYIKWLFSYILSNYLLSLQATLNFANYTFLN